MFWSMSQIGSTVGQIGSTVVTCSANQQIVNAVSDNIIINNCAIWPKERTVLCQIRRSLEWCAIWAYQKQ